MGDLLQSLLCLFHAVDGFQNDLDFLLPGIVQPLILLGVNNFGIGQIAGSAVDGGGAHTADEPRCKGRRTPYPGS